MRTGEAMKKRYLFREEGVSIYTAHPVGREDHTPVAEQNVPMSAKVLERIAAALWLLPCFVWFGWLVGWGTIDPSEIHEMVVGSVFYFVLGLVLAFIGTLVRRTRS
jgi:hypothetical protein